MHSADSSPTPDEPRRHRSAPSHFLHWLGELSQRAGASAAAAVASAAFLLAALLAPRATPWLTAFEALAAAVTLVMIFVLQHTQARQQTALQRKLDEILRVLPGADNRLLHVETASEHELSVLAEQHIRVRQDAVLDHPEG